MAKKQRKKVKLYPKFKRFKTGLKEVVVDAEYVNSMEEKFTEFRAPIKEIITDTLINNMIIIDQSASRVVRTTLQPKIETTVVKSANLNTNHEYIFGNRVKLKLGKYPPSKNNPCIGSKYECEGVISFINHNSSYCSVNWDNGMSNTYCTNKDLKVISKELINCKSIW